jgi:hypothetical protein
MPRLRTTEPKTVHIYPIEGVFIGGVPAIEQDVTEAEAKRLLEYKPPAFVIDPLYGAAEDKQHPEGE